MLTFMGPKLFDCEECGDGEVRMGYGAGRVYEYKHGSWIEIPVKMEIATCCKCSAFYLNVSEADELDNYVKKVLNGE